MILFNTLYRFMNDTKYGTEWGKYMEIDTIDNYKRLLFTIMKSEPESKCEKDYAIVVYEVKNSYLPIATFNNIIPCAMFLNTGTRTVVKCIKKNLKIKNAIAIECVEI